ncbi:MAG: type II secretion system F family protein [Anaerolineae bacterium]|nr:MAG: type II secretion system F family protein [Anaerolineae bacterium]MCL4879936.1 type II secretion system F family protein [Anaerolineae bacterium]
MEFLVIGGGALLAFGILAFGIYTIRRDRQKQIEERLGRYTSEYGSQLSELLEAEGTQLHQATSIELLQEAADKAIAESNFASIWKSQLSRADLKLTPAEFLGMHFVSVIGFFLAAYLVVFRGNIILSLIAGVIGFFAPRIWVSMKIGRRLNQFESQLPDNLQMWVNGLRSGYSVLQAIEGIAREAAEPTATEFKRVVKEVQLGIPMDEALDHMLTRMPSDDLDLVITAVNIQREVGGNLAEILEVISHTIRERIKLKGEIRVLTAQGRVTGYIIGGMPVFLLGFLMMANPDYVGRLFENRMCGWPMLGCGAGMISLGVAVIQRIIDIEI